MNTRGPQPRIHLDDIEHLLRCGESVDQIAHQIGVHRRSIARNAARHGRPDLGRRFDVPRQQRRAS